MVEQAGGGENPLGRGDVYAEAWAELRKRLRILMAVYVSAIPGIGLLGWFFSDIFGQALALPVVVGCWIGVLITCSISLAHVDCPYCGNPFFRNVLFCNPWTGNCCVCGVQVGSSPKTWEKDDT